MNSVSLYFYLESIFLFVDDLNIKHFDVTFKEAQGSFGCFFFLSSIFYQNILCFHAVDSSMAVWEPLLTFLNSFEKWRA